MEKPIESLVSNGIFALEQVPDADARVIVLMHGINSDLTEDRSRDKPGIFDIIVDLAGQCGIGTIRFDFRSHGDSVPVDGHVSIRSEIADIHVVLDDAKARGRRVEGFVAASFGACAASAVLAGQGSLKSAVFLNPVLRPLETFLDPGSAWARQSINPDSLARLAATGSLLLDETFPLGRSFIDDLRTFRPAADLLKYAGALSIIHGTADTYVPFEYSREESAVLGCGFLPIKGAEHGFGVIRDREFVAAETVRFTEWAIGR